MSLTKNMDKLQTAVENLQGTVGNVSFGTNTSSYSASHAPVRPEAFLSDKELDRLMKSEFPKDKINPNHYKSHPSGVECIQITEHYNFCVGNAIKYLWRNGQKEGETNIDDLKKAIWYIEREIKNASSKV